VLKQDFGGDGDKNDPADSFNFIFKEVAETFADEDAGIAENKSRKANDNDGQQYCVCNQ
jgi:hypothetical protein